MSDSDELSTTTAGRKLRRDSSVRKKRCSLGSSSTIDVAAAANSAAAESDSLNENLSSAAVQGGRVMSSTRSMCGMGQPVWDDIKIQEIFGDS